MSSTNNDSEDDDPRVHSSGMMSSSSQPGRRYELSKSELRKNNKPIMEKKRRARINQCLNELKTLILDALKKDPARHTKLEKADILEMTVRHLQSLHRSGGRPPTASVEPPSSSSSSSSSTAALTAAVVQKFQTGYQECAGEVNRFVDRLDGVDDDIKKRLMSHLDSCVAKMRYVAAAATAPPPPPPPLQQQLQQRYALQPQQQFDPLTSSDGVRLQLLPPVHQNPPPLPPPVGRHRTSAFTAVRGLSPAPDAGVPLVYCDEPAVSSTSSWAEDAAAAAVAAGGGVCCKHPPLDFSMKKLAAASNNKRPLGDIPVNVVPTSAAAASSSRKTSAATVACDRGPTPPAQRPEAAPNDGLGSDPNMWRPW